MTVTRFEDRVEISYPFGKKSTRTVTLKNGSLLHTATPKIPVEEATDEQLEEYAPIVVKTIKDYKKMTKALKL
ncbi:hypothetical protein P10VF_140 [Rhizobium phage vB_RleM_P10VF]|uniref:Uncharacterized protein n=1 Tax=Rhizobium phage vB_RleM_P10VF TaxID=1527770 RepID=A0A076YIT4_9CAUD|nr:hypothetical protein P10VF_140 [Rhizobium phage vB_RleM_P10VF]AIK68353.1 hypothetical protein P10VF_140 [Rhizobium phage vB_RleM_P10VF]